MPDHATGPGGTSTGQQPVAVVGMSCRLPGAADPEEFWALLRDGRDAVGLPSPRRQALGTPAVPGGYLDAVDEFDAELLRIPPVEAAAMDPQQRLSLELIWAALEDAGIAPTGLRGSGAAVVVGVMADDYATLTLRREGRPLSRYAMTGLHRSLLANRVSYLLGLRGPEPDPRLRTVVVRCRRPRGVREPAPRARARSRSPEASTSSWRPRAPPSAERFGASVAERPLPHLRRRRRRLRPGRGRRPRRAQAARRGARRRRPGALRHPRQRGQQRRRRRRAHRARPRGHRRSGPARPARRAGSTRRECSTSSCTAPAPGSATRSRRPRSAPRWVRGRPAARPAAGRLGEDQRRPPGGRRRRSSACSRSRSAPAPGSCPRA